MVDGASFSPFTAGISPGELLAIFGTGLAPSHAEDPLFPNSLNGVAVTINNIPAPIYVADPTQLTVLVPYGIAVDSIADILVTNNGVASKHVTAFVSTTSPGIFSGTANGLGYPAALHNGGNSGYVPVTPQNPAQPNEWIAVYLTGLGPVIPNNGSTTLPAYVAGALGPVNPLYEMPSRVPHDPTDSSDPQVTVAAQSSKSNFAGIAPLQRGLYQINVRVPANASAGNLFLEVQAPDAVNSQVKIPVAGAALPNARSATDAPQFGARPRPPQGSHSTRRGLGSSVTTDTSSSGGQ